MRGNTGISENEESEAFERVIILLLYRFFEKMFSNIQYMHIINMNTYNK